MSCNAPDLAAARDQATSVVADLSLSTRRVVLSCVAAIFLAGGYARGMTSHAGNTHPLLSEANAELPSWVAKDPDVHVRSATSRLDVDQLRAMADAPSDDGQAFELRLFEDATYSVRVRKIDRPAPNRFVIYGTIQGDREDSSGSAIISVVGGVAHASVSAPDGRSFEITNAGDLHRVCQIDWRRIPRCGSDDAPQPVSKTHSFSVHAESAASPQTSVTSTPSATPAAPVIDVMIVYTPAMLAQAGSVPAMEAMCQTAVATADQAFADSGINAHLRLVHTQLVQYVESGDSAIDVGRLQNPSDGFMDEVPRLQDQYSADVVHLFVSKLSDGHSGMGFVTIIKEGILRDSAYGVELGSYATHAFPHELGHNLGCAHDRANAGTSPAQAFSYSYGCSFTGADGVVYGDIMSYIGAPTQRYSNPGILYKGAPAGFSKASNNSADNATTINSTAAIVAGYREPNMQNTPECSLAAPSDGTTFPAAAIGNSGASKYAFIRNHGSAPLVITNFGFQSGGSDFLVGVYLSSSIVPNGGGWPPVADPSTFVIDPHGYAELVLNYVPSNYREADATLSFVTNDPRLGNRQQTLNLTGGVGPRLKNISTRLQVGTGDNVLIGGFIVGGSSPRKVMIRAIGPSLGSSGITGALSDPTLELYQGATLLASNDDWGSGVARDALTLSGLAPSNDLESAILVTLPPGSYTTIVRGSGGSTGVALVEAYVLDADGSAEVLNISTRGNVAKGDNVMIGGFIVGDGHPTRVIVRAIGPSLSSSGISHPLQDPTLELHGADGTLLAANDNWRSTQEQEITGAGLPPHDDRESAIVATLEPGSYTAIVRGANGATGVALVEVYKLPPANPAVILASNLNLNTLAPNAVENASWNGSQGYSVGQILTDDPTDLYWFESDGSQSATGGAIKRVGKQGGAVTVMASGLAPVNGLAQDAQSVYWIESVSNGDGLLKKLNKDGSGITLLASGMPPAPLGTNPGLMRYPGALCVDADSVYWIDQAAWKYGLIRRIAKTGGEVSTLYIGSLERYSLQCDDTTLYFLDAHGSISALAKTGGAPNIIASNAYVTANYPASSLPTLVLSSGYLVVMDSAGTLTAAPQLGGSSVKLATAITPHNVALDTSSAYYETGGAIYRVPLAGGDQSLVSPYSNEGSNPFCVAVDATRVYYSNVGSAPGTGAILSFSK